MGYDLDITVTSAGGYEITMMVQAKIKLSQFDEAERQLKEDMTGMGCPVGLIVTPQRLWLYRNRYLGTEDSIEQLGEFDVEQLLGFAGPRRGRNEEFEFQDLVQRWLEGLRTGPGLRELPSDLRCATELYIVPELWQGDIGAAHPRPSLTA